ILQKLDVIRVERLQSAWAFELQSPRFSHNRGMPLPRTKLTKTIHQRPVRSILWRLFHAHDNKIAACRFWDYVCSREMAFLPAVRFFRELAIGIVNVNRYLRLIDFCSEPEPVFVSFEQLLSHSFLLSRAEVSSPIILAHLKALFDVRFCCLKRKRLRIVHGSENRRPQCREDQQQRACANKNLHEAVHRRSNLW